MKVQTCFVFASMLAGALAAPLRQRDTVVHTEFVNVVEVVSLTSTLYVNPGETPAAKHDLVVSTTQPAAMVTSTPVQKNTYTPPAVKKPSPKIPSPTTAAVPTTESKKQEPTTTTTAQPTTTAPPKKAVTTSAPPPASSSKAPTNSGTAGSKSGEATYYATGQGSCGIESSPSEMVVAISHVLMDAATVGGNTNGNPLCGKKIKCTRGDKSVTVTVVDRCAGCASGDLDFSEAAFKQLASTDEGRVNVKWDWL